MRAPDSLGALHLSSYQLRFHISVHVDPQLLPYDYFTEEEEMSDLRMSMFNSM